MTPTRFIDLALLMVAVGAVAHWHKGGERTTRNVQSADSEPIAAATTLADMVDRRNNNFLVIRRVSSWLVLYAHCYALNLQTADPLSGVLRIYTGAFGVYVFFLISGFLISASFERRGIGEYFEARAPRIFSGLFVANVFAALLIGPLATTLPLGQYLRNPQVWGYILDNTALIHLQGSLPGVFQDLPMKSVNGSLWTLPYELRAYLLTAFLAQWVL